MLALSQEKEKLETEYLAFISYRHADNTEEDQQWATWLHQQLEVYDIPADLIGTKNLRGEIIPERIYPVFRDEVSLPADADLSNAITHALDCSRILIVLCSPRAVQSRYVNEEILHFKRSEKQDRIMAALLQGEPNASIDDAKQENPKDLSTLECFPPALQYHLQESGELDISHPTEPIAANFRLPGGGKGITNPQVYKQRLLEQGRKKAEAECLADAYEEQLNTARLKIIAGILGVRLEQLVERDKIYQLHKAKAASKRLMKIAGVMSILAVIAIIGGSLAFHQWGKAEEEKARAEELIVQMKTQLGFMNFKLKDVMDNYVPQNQRVPIMQRIDELVNALQQYGGKSAAEQRLIAVAMLQKAELILKNDQLDPNDALALMEKGHEILLSIQDPDDKVQRDVSASHFKLGDIHLRLGETTAVLEHYEKGLKIRQTLAEQDPKNLQFQRDISYSFGKLGDIHLRLGETAAALVRYEKSLKIRQTLAQKNPNNIVFQRDLTVSYERLGDIHLRLGETAAAMVRYEKSLKIRQTLAQQDPKNTQFQLDLSVTYIRLGDIRLQLGETTTTLVYYENGLKTHQLLVKGDPNNIEFQNDLSLSHERLGGVRFRLGETAAALVHYENKFKITQLLIQRDPDNTEFQRNHSLSHEKLGHIRFRLGETAAAMTHFETSLKINLMLLQLDSKNTQFQSDVSRSHERLGDIRLALGEAAAALTHYETGLKINLTLLQLDLKNTEFQRAVSVLHSKLGDIRLRLGETDLVSTHYEKSLEIAKALVEQDPNNTKFKRDVSVLHERIGDIRLRLGETTAALAHYEKGLEVSQKLMQLVPNNIEFQGEVFY